MKARYVVLIALAGSLAAIAIFFFVFIYNPNDPIPVDFSKTDRMELWYQGVQPEKILDTDKQEDIEKVTEILKTARGGGVDLGTPMCPFGICIVLHQGGKKMSIELGTDNCGVIQYSGQYYHTREDQTLKLQGIIEELTGRDFDTIRL